MQGQLTARSVQVTASGAGPVQGEALAGDRFGIKMEAKHRLAGSRSSQNRAEALGSSRLSRGKEYRHPRTQARSHTPKTGVNLLHVMKEAASRTEGTRRPVWAGRQKSKKPPKNQTPPRPQHTPPHSVTWEDNKRTQKVTVQGVPCAGARLHPQQGGLTRCCMRTASRG